MIIDEILEKLNQKQKEAVLHKEGPLLIAAGAGSGKTRTITSRVLHLLQMGVLPEQILAITFTNKAAGEMRSRIIDRLKKDDQRLFVGTFHSLGARLLKKESSYLGRTAGYTIFDDEDASRLIKKIFKDKILKKEINPVYLQNLIAKTKDELAEEPDDLKLRIFFRQYEAALQENNAFDFADLIQKIVICFQQHPAVLKKYQSLWRFILIDEFQDVNTSQYRLAQLLAEDHKNICVVGDDFQSIFAFRGADFRNFLNFEKDWPTVRVIFLEENYRSAGNIIQGANAVIANNTQQKKKLIWTKNEAGELISVIAAGDENEEAELVMEEVIKLIRQGAILEEMALLYRTNAQSRALEQQCLVRGIPYRIFGGVRFYDRKEIKDVVAALRLVLNPKDSVSAERLLKTFSKKTGVWLVAQLSEIGPKKDVPRLIQFFLETTDYFNYLERNYHNFQERKENIDELIVFASEQGDLPSFLEQISLATSADTASKKSQRPGLNLMSIHLAKGLEFKTVFVVGCNDGVLPHQRSFGERLGIEEERRLMYVAMTRAKKNLFLSFFNTPSRFLYEITPELINFRPSQPSKRNVWELDEDERYIEYE